jgi:N-acetylated-alpha-linked acidic dipeptidase
MKMLVFFLAVVVISHLSDGAVYTRYGKTSCPSVSGTSKIYNGVMAGTGYGQTGGASDFLCLPYYPQYSTYRTRSQYFSRLVPAEYEQPVRNNGHNYNAPCAVCYTTRSDTMMIPARTSCYSGWTLEYTGYLVTESDGNKHSTKYICVDQNYEVLSGSAGHTHQATDLYHVEVDCSSGIIPCAFYQYNSFREITCSVCSK